MMDSDTGHAMETQCRCAEGCGRRCLDISTSRSAKVYMSYSWCCRFLYVVLSKGSGSGAFSAACSEEKNNVWD